MTGGGGPAAGGWLREGLREADRVSEHTHSTGAVWKRAPCPLGSRDAHPHTEGFEEQQRAGGRQGGEECLYKDICFLVTVTENTTGVKAGQHRTEALDRAGLGCGGAEGV